MLTLDDVIPLCVTDWVAPTGHPLVGERGQMFAFAIRHLSGLMLFDTGFGRDSANLTERFAAMHHPIEDELARHGFAPEDVTRIANSHLHFDHCGNNPLFPNALIYAQADEYQAAHEPRYTIAEWVNFPGAKYELVNGDFEVVSGVTILATRGHTVGHQSLLLETTEGPVVLTGQAIYCRAEYEHIRDTGTLLAPYVTPGDEDHYLRSAQRLIDIRARRVLFSHDSLPVDAAG